MNGNDVNFLMNPENRIVLDEEKTKEQLSLKLTVFDVAFHNFEASQIGDAIKGDNYAFVPFPCGAFVDLIIEAFTVLGSDTSKKFLDIGCGIGTKVILATSLFDSYGIEYDEVYCEKAKSLGLNRVGLVDAMLFDKYDQFDLLYYYRPIHDSAKYREFESKVHAEMRPGALVAPMHTEYDWDSCEDIERLSKFLYRKRS
jgi:2-polyprenyl-3-methyl-5-hydroxy-6-metoxy-1,4-benzoquinol methylase